MKTLEDLLKRKFPDSNFHIYSKFLYKAAEFGYVTYDELARENSEDIDDFLLSMYEARILLPVRISESVRSVSWDARQLILKKRERFEMPLITRYLVKDIIKSEKWSVNRSLRQCLLDQGIQNLECYIRAIDEVLDWALRNEYMIDAESISGIAMKYRIEPNEFIAVLKNTGVISPCSRRFISNKKIHYEVNPVLYWSRKIM